MKLKFVNPNTLEKNIKATIHKSGKLGFTVEAAKKLELSAEKSVLIAINDEDENDKSLYMQIKDGILEDAFKVYKAGDYYYVNTKAFFDSLQMDYVQETFVYDIHVVEIEGQAYFKFKPRPVKKSKRPPQSQLSES